MDDLFSGSRTGRGEGDYDFICLAEHDGCAFIAFSFNAINHLASAEHLKSLKDFLWRYGGGMDRIDSFRVVESDLAKVLLLFS